MRTASRWPVPTEVHGDGRFVRSRDGFVPNYVRAHEAGVLSERIDQALDELAPCDVCPRPCRDVDRLADRVGACRIGRHARVASAFPHFGEEDVLRGWHGSGTIFMAGCNLRCVFCQNGDISQAPVGREVTAADLAGLMLDLQAQECHNINIVTPEHVVPQVLEALPIAVERGLRLPLVYNTSAYDSPRSIDLLDGVVDVYMPDIKLFDPQHAHRYLGMRDYPQIVRRTVASGRPVADRPPLASHAPAALDLTPIAAERSWEYGMPIDPDDILVTVAHPWGDIEIPFRQWARVGPGPRPYVQITAARRRSTGEAIPLSDIDDPWQRDPPTYTGPG